MLKFNIQQNLSLKKVKKNFVEENLKAKLRDKAQERCASS